MNAQLVNSGRPIQSTISAWRTRLSTPLRGVISVSVQFVAVAHPGKPGQVPPRSAVIVLARAAAPRRSHDVPSFHLRFVGQTSLPKFLSRADANEAFSASARPQRPDSLSTKDVADMLGAAFFDLHSCRIIKASPLRVPASRFPGSMFPWGSEAQSGFSQGSNRFDSHENRDHPMMGLLPLKKAARPAPPPSRPADATHWLWRRPCWHIARRTPMVRRFTPKCSTG